MAPWNGPNYDHWSVEPLAELCEADLLLEKVVLILTCDLFALDDDDGDDDVIGLTNAFDTALRQYSALRLMTRFHLVPQ